MGFLKHLLVTEIDYRLVLLPVSLNGTLSRFPSNMLLAGEYPFLMDAILANLNDTRVVGHP